MASINQIFLVGRIGNDLKEDTTTLANGNQVVEIRLAVKRPVKDENNQEITDWIACKFWNRKAEVLNQNLGEKIVVSKFKAKTGYRRKLGFRPRKTTLLIKKIEIK